MYFLVSDLQDKVDMFSLPSTAHEKLPFVYSMINGTLAEKMGYRFDELVFSCEYERQKCSLIR